MSETEMIKQAITNKYFLESGIIPELGAYKKGKTGDNFFSDDYVIIVRTDRLSSFDIVSKQFFPFKGEVLTNISYQELKATGSKVPNALVDRVDPNVLVQKRAKNLGVEFIVRGYFTGSLWRDYAKGQRKFPWFTLPDGLKQYQKFDDLMFTPTTKAETGHDMSISLEDIVKMGYCTNEELNQVEEYCYKLFEMGSKSAKKKGLILVDTKYEFARDKDGNIIVIDEIHTLDSSRYWILKDYDEKFARGEAPEEESKEFARGGFMKAGFINGDTKLPLLSDETRIETVRKYLRMNEKLTGQTIRYDPNNSVNIGRRMVSNLTRNGYLEHGGLVVLLAASIKDEPHYNKIAGKLKELKIPCIIPAPASAHKDTRKVLNTLDYYNQSIQPIVYVTVAGRSNGLGPIVAGNTKRPVITCPPFKDAATMQNDIWSSLRMPSELPMSVIIDPENAALQAKRVLDLAV